MSRANTPVQPGSRPQSVLSRHLFRRNVPSPFTAARQQALASLSRQLVASVTHHLEPEAANARADRISATLAAGLGAQRVLTQQEVDESYRDYARRIRITHSAPVAAALDDVKTRLSAEHHSNSQSQILIQALYLLVSIATVPENDTLSAALVARNSAVNAPSTLSWKELMSDPPFEGEHWDDDDSTSSTSSDDFSFELDSGSTLYSPVIMESTPVVSPPSVDRVLEPRDQMQDRAVVESFRSRQHWRECNDRRSNVPFNINRPASLAAALGDHDTRHQTIFVHEVDLVRECLLTLQGSTILEASTYRLAHISSSSQAATLARISSLSRKVADLRLFSGAIFTLALKRHPIRTLEAFATGIRLLLDDFATQCAQIEAEIICAQQAASQAVTATLLSLLARLREPTQLFNSLHDLVHGFSTPGVGPLDSISDLALRLANGSPATVARLILDDVFGLHQVKVAVGELSIARKIGTLLNATAEPLWKMSATWLRDGLSVEPMQWGQEHLYGPRGEFFVERHTGCAPNSPEFWTQAYSLRREDDAEDAESGASLVPRLFEPLARSLLATGKTVGLLRILGVDTVTSAITEQVRCWRSVEDVVSSRGQLDLDGERTASALDEHLQSCFEMVQSGFKSILVEKCRFWPSLTAVQGLCYSSHGDIISDFCDAVFRVMDEQGPTWNPDTYFLQSTFQDAITIAGSEHAFVNPDLVRFPRTGVRRRPTSAHTVEGLGLLSVEILHIFPLVYFFNTTAMQTYSTTFSYLFQIKRAKRALDDTFQLTNSPDMREFQLLRHRIDWLIRTVENYTSSNLQVLAEKLRDNLERATTFDDMLICHEEHLQTAANTVFLDSNGRAIRVQVIKILDAALEFRTAVWEHFGIDPSQQPNVRRRPTARRRTTRARMLEIHESDSEQESEGEANVIRPSMAHARDRLLADGQLRKIQEQVIKAVVQIRSALDGLVADAADHTSPFALLSFHFHSGWDL